MDRTEFVKIYDFEPQAQANPDEVMAATNAKPAVTALPPPEKNETDELLRSLGM